MALDYSSLDPLKAASTMATTGVADLTMSAPSMLQALQHNLTSIFAKDNPFIQDRATALATYLSTPSATRAELLPSNLPTVEGSPLNLSPTQQNAIGTARESAALAPLVGLNQAVTGIYGNIPQLVGNAGNIYSSLVTAATSKAQLARQAYEDAFKELTTKEELRIKDLSTRLTGGGEKARSTAVLNNVATDASRGVTLTDLLRKYGTQSNITPNDIYQIYNRYNYKTSEGEKVGYGPARESETQLASFGVKPTSTAEQRNRQAALEPAFTAISSVKGLDIKETGTPKADSVVAKINFPTGIGKKFIGKNEQNLVSLNQNFQLMRQNVVRALQGARMSDTDIKIAEQYIPTIQDSPETIKTNLANLENFLNSLGIGNTTTGSSSSSSVWEVIQ